MELCCASLALAAAFLFGGCSAQHPSLHSVLGFSTSGCSWASGPTKDKEKVTDHCSVLQLTCSRHCLLALSSRKCGADKSCLLRSRGFLICKCSVKESKQTSPSAGNYSGSLSCGLQQHNYIIHSRMRLSRVRAGEPEKIDKTT